MVLPRAVLRRTALPKTVLGLLLLAVVLAAASPAGAGLRRIFVDAGARTAALTQLLREEGGVEIAPEATAEVRVVLREAGATWRLEVLDRSGRRVLRRDIGAAGGDLAALRVAALLVEQALHARAVLPDTPLPPPALAATRSATRTATVVARAPDGSGGVRALPPSPLMPTAASLLANASALPRVRTATLSAAADTPDGPRIGGLRRRSAAAAAGTTVEGAVASAPAPGAPPARDAAARETVTRDADRAASVPAGPPATEPRTPAVDRDEEARAAASERRAALLAERDAPSPRPAPDDLAAGTPTSLRLVASVGARWWNSPGDVPQLGFGAGAEGRVGPLMLGGAVRLAGAPCCERTSTSLTASVYEIGLAAYGLLPIVGGGSDPLTLWASAELDGAMMTGEARLVSAGESGTATDLQGFSATLGVGPALELRLGDALAVRLRAALRVSLAVYEIDTGGFSDDTLHTGWIHPYVDLAIPLSL